MSGWHEGEGYQGDPYRGPEYVSEYRSEQPSPQQPGPGQFHGGQEFGQSAYPGQGQYPNQYEAYRFQPSQHNEYVTQTDEWYRETRHAEQELWYPEIPPDEAPEARAVRRAAYAEAIDATRFNMPAITPGFLDPSSLQQLIPPRRGQVQGPGTLDEAPSVEAAPKEQSAAKSVSKATRIMAMGTMASRITGMMRSVMLAAALGTLGVGDAFAIGNNLPNMIYALVIGGAVNAIFVPQLVRSMKDDRDGGQAFIDRLLTMTIVFVGAVTVIAVIAAPALVHAYASGYTGPQQEVAILFARYCLPQILFYALSVMLGQILNAKDSFGPVMWTPVLANVVQIAALGCFMWIVGGIMITPQTITTNESILLGLGSTLGIVLQAMTLIPYLRSVGVTFRPRFDWRGTGLGKSMTLAKWTLLSVLIQFVVSWAITDMATTMGDHFPNDGVGFSAYSNALMLWTLPQGVITVSIITALLPRMSRSAHAGDKRAVGDAISYGLRSTGVAIVPCAFIFLAFAQQTVSILFGHGNMSTDQVHNEAYMLMGFSLGLIPFSAFFVMIRAFYAYEDTRTPFFIQMGIGLVNIGLGFLAFEVLGHTTFAVAGMCVAYSISYLVGCVITARKLRPLVGAFDARRVLRVHIKLCVAAGLATVVGGPVGLYITDLRGAGTIGAVAGFAVGGALFMAVFVVAARKMRVEELNSFLGTLKARLGR